MANLPMLTGLGMRIGAWFRDRSVRRELLESPRVRLAELPEDMLGRVVGTVHAAGPVLEAPLTKRLCVYYAFELQLWRATGPTVIRDEQNAVPFTLIDRGDEALVDTRSATISSNFDRGVRVAWKGLDYKDHRLLETWKVPPPERGTAYYFREAAIELDDTICIYGAGIREFDTRLGDDLPGVAYRDGVKTRLHLTGSERFPLVISDDPRVTSPGGK